MTAESVFLVSCSTLSSLYPVLRFLIGAPLSIHLTYVSAATQLADMASTALVLLILSSLISLAGERHSDASNLLQEHLTLFADTCFCFTVAVLFGEPRIYGGEFLFSSKFVDEKSQCICCI